MNRRLLFVVLLIVVAVSLAIVLPVSAGKTENACHSTKFHGIEIPDFPNVPIPIDPDTSISLWYEPADAPSPFTAEHWRIVVDLLHGHDRKLVLDYYENWGPAGGNPFDELGFQCRTEPLFDDEHPEYPASDDSDLQILICTADNKRPDCSFSDWVLFPISP